MAWILHIETSTKNCSVALSENDKVSDLLEYAGQGYSHAEKLHVFIDKILKKNGLKLQNLSAISVSKGPGSYTGLRIGVSTAKGLAYALKIPLISVSTLQHMAQQIRKNGFIIPMIDARRMEVYSAVFDQDYQMIREVQAEIINKNSFTEYLEQKQVFFLGDGVFKVKEIITHPNAIFTDFIYPSAKEMTAISYQKFVNKDFEDIAYFEPFYLKDFIATQKLKK